ncbi:hypothetical protein [uncultured Leifsonia sp.]|jgi:hypothetical protein|uniref:hypothetical protein n=1 Tax=Leifsonia sp. TaxID=1870902 RepID=UPI0028D39EE4|nr:hypothetical protein [uncultured Leifsonia sp.]
MNAHTENGETFVAVFLFPEELRDSFSLRLPVRGLAPPAAIRAAATFAGAAAVDVFRLIDGSSWPASAAYLYAETVPGTVVDDSMVEQVATPDD